MDRKSLRKFIKLRGDKLTEMRKEFDEKLSEGKTYNPSENDLEIIRLLDKAIQRATKRWGI